MQLWAEMKNMTVNFKIIFVNFGRFHANKEQKASTFAFLLFFFRMAYI